MDEWGNPRLLAYSQILSFWGRLLSLSSLCCPAAFLEPGNLCNSCFWGPVWGCMLGVGLGRAVFWAVPWNPRHSYRPAGYQQVLVSRQESEPKDSQEGQRVWLVRRGGRSLQRWELSPEHCLFPTALLSAQNREAEVFWKEIWTKVIQCGRVPVSAPPVTAYWGVEDDGKLTWHPHGWGCWPLSLSLLGSILSPTLSSAPWNFTGHWTWMKAHLTELSHSHVEWMD